MNPLQGIHISIVIPLVNEGSSVTPLYVRPTQVLTALVKGLRPTAKVAISGMQAASPRNPRSSCRCQNTIPASKRTAEARWHFPFG